MKIYKSIKFLKYNNLRFYLSTKISLDKYNQEVDKILNHIFEKIDEKEFDFVDTNLVNGVLSFSFNRNKNYVINVQRPNMQIWLSSPISGPQRFEFNSEDNTWINIRNNKCLLDILNDEINNMLKDNKIDERFDL